MKVALVNYTLWPSLTIGLGSLIASLKQEGHSVRLIDLVFMPYAHRGLAQARHAGGNGQGVKSPVISSPFERIEQTHHWLMEELKRYAPQVIGISTGFDSEDIVALIREIREELGEIPVLIGGVRPDYRPIPDPDGHQELQTEAVWTFAGESNTALVQFLRELEGGRFPKVPAIISGPEDLDRLPVPDYTLFDMPNYLKTSTVLSGHLPLLASKGCSYGCRFCTYSNRVYQHRIPRLVLEEVHVQEERHRRDGLMSLGFYDPTFGLYGHYFNELMELFHQDRLGDRLPWFCQTRPELVTREWAQKVANGGGLVVQLGLESGVEQVRYTTLNKNFSNTLFRCAVKNLRQAGLNCEINIMTGLPGSSLGQEIRSFLFAERCMPDAINISHYHPNPVTSLGGGIDRIQWKKDGGASLLAKRNVNRLLKLCMISHFFVRGIGRYGRAYVKTIARYILNLDRERVLPLAHPLTLSFLSNRPLHDLKWHQKMRQQRKGQRP